MRKTGEVNDGERREVKREKTGVSDGERSEVNSGK